MNKKFLSVFLVLLFVSLKNVAEGKLHKLVKANNLEEAESLLDRNADVNEEYFGCTPLQIAVSNKALDMVKMLVGNGADINKFTFSCPFSPLDLASCFFPDEDMVKLLLSLNANPNCEIHCQEIPLHRAALGANFEIIKRLIEAGAEVNKPDLFNSTPLHMICLAQKGIHHPDTDGLEAMALLLANGADMEAKDISGKTPRDLVSDPAKEVFFKKRRIQ